VRMRMGVLMRHDRFLAVERRALLGNLRNGENENATGPAITAFRKAVALNCSGAGSVTAAFEFLQPCSGFRPDPRFRFGARFETGDALGPDAGQRGHDKPFRAGLRLFGFESDARGLESHDPIMTRRRRLFQTVMSQFQKTRRCNRAKSGR
jgi:hypothetical protein